MAGPHGDAPLGDQRLDLRERRAALGRSDDQGLAWGSRRRLIALTQAARRKTGVVRYFRPESTRRVATQAVGPSAIPTRIAARTLAPDEVPANSPSSLARRRAMLSASSVAIGMMSSTRRGSHIGGPHPMPIPSIRWAPGAPPESTADSAGSTATI